MVKENPKTGQDNPIRLATARPVVAIVGRQNVGKSTLLNRLAGKRIAIVEDLPGTTRDRLFADVSWEDKEFTLIDTGGMETVPDSSLAQEVNRQVKMAMDEADVILFVVDARDGMLPDDEGIANQLRPAKKRVLLVANKADNDKMAMAAAEFAGLGLGQPVAISAYHGRGINDLLEAIMPLLPQTCLSPSQADTIKVAIVGRPNVGKSMLLNSILGEERVIVSEIPGTTRDAIDTKLDFEGQSVILIDTAGIKRKGRQGSGADRYSVIRSLEAIDRADVVLLVVDATELVAAQDLHIAGHIEQAFKGIVIVVSKRDLAPDLNKNEVSRYLRSKFKFLSHAPILYTSAKIGTGIKEVIPQAIKVFQERLKRIGTAEVNSTLQQVIGAHSPPHKGNHILKFFYATQAEVNPPTFVFFVNDASLMHFSYKRYLENQLRHNFGFEGTPLRLVFKTRGEK